MSRNQINAYLMALFIFQFGFLQPIASLVGSQWPTAVFSSLLFGILLINNNFKLPKHVIFIFTGVSAYFLLNYIIFHNEISVLIYIEWVFKCFSAVLFASVYVTGKDLYRAFLHLALVNFLAIFLFPFTEILTSMNYMRFGYAMIPSTIMFTYAFFFDTKHRPFWLTLALTSLLLTFLYGSRGPVIVYGLFAALFFAFCGISKTKKILLASIGAVSIIIIHKTGLLMKLVGFVYFDLQVRTYALAKVWIFLTQGLAASSSGRERIYGQIIEIIRLNPWIGNGIGITQLEIDFTAHNILLQILAESGFLGLLLWLVFWIYLLTRYIKLSKFADRQYFYITTLVLSIALGRLTISSDIWMRPEYWFAIPLLINFGRQVNAGISQIADLNSSRACPSFLRFRK